MIALPFRMPFIPHHEAFLLRPIVIARLSDPSTARIVGMVSVLVANRRAFDTASNDPIGPKPVLSFLD
jgi:hypothetical protein